MKEGKSAKEHGNDRKVWGLGLGVRVDGLARKMEITMLLGVTRDYYGIGIHPSFPTSSRKPFITPFTCSFPG